MAAVEIRRRRFDRQVDEAELFVHGDLRPHADVAVDRPRVLLPRLVAELARTRNRVELPELLAGPHVEGAHQALGVVVRRDGRAFAERDADDHDVSGDDRRRVNADLAGLEIDLLVVAVDDARPSGRRCRLLPNDVIGCAGLRVQRDEPIAGRHVEDALVALAVGPVRHAAARQLPRRHGGALAFAHAVRPDQLAGLRRRAR